MPSFANKSRLPGDALEGDWTVLQNMDSPPTGRTFPQWYAVAPNASQTSLLNLQECQANRNLGPFQPCLDVHAFIAGCRDYTQATCLPLNVWSCYKDSRYSLKVQAGCLLSKNERVLANHIYEHGILVSASLSHESRQ